MEVAKQNISRKILLAQKSQPEELLKNGQSVTKAIMRGGKGCCGGAHVEGSS